MDPGEVPAELKGLTFIEQLLISPVKSVFSVFRLTKGGQFGFRGNVINFRQDISTFVNQMPRTLKSVSDTLIVRKEASQTDPNVFNEFRVRKTVIYNAIKCLLRINSLYRSSVNLNKMNLDLLPDDANVLELLSFLEVTSEEDASESEESEEQDQNQFEHTGVINIMQPNVRDQVDRVLNGPDDEQSILPFPTLQPGPISETTPGYIPLAFPCLFPTGNFLIINV